MSLLTNFAHPFQIKVFEYSEKILTDHKLLNGSVYICVYFNCSIFAAL